MHLLWAPPIKMDAKMSRSGNLRPAVRKDDLILISSWEVQVHSVWVNFEWTTYTISTDLGLWPARSHNLALRSFPTCGNGWNELSSFLVEVWLPAKSEPALRNFWASKYQKFVLWVSYNIMSFEMRRVRLVWAICFIFSMMPDTF